MIIEQAQADIMGAEDVEACTHCIEAVFDGLKRREYFVMHVEFPEKVASDKKVTDE